MKITYIHHSSFLAELEEVVFLFDYFEGEIPVFDENKPLVVFASHRHGDHFAPVIFQLAERYKNVSYVLSDDIWRKRVPEELRDRTMFVAPDEEYCLKLVKEERENGEHGADGTHQVKAAIQTFCSTDEGVAFLIKVKENGAMRTIYHAGDLNHWVWEGEPEEYNTAMRDNYRKELEKMAGCHIDIAFMLLDPRQEKDFWLGMDDFMRMVGADVVFPMHFWGDFGVTERFKTLPCAEGYKDRIQEISCKGQSFTVS